MSPAISTFLFEAVNFLLLAAALGWLFFQPIRASLAARRDEMESEEQRARELLTRAKSARDEAQAERDQLRRELEEERGRRLAAASAEAARLLEEAREEAERERRRRLAQATQLDEAGRDLLASAAASAAAEAVGELLRRIDGPDLHAALVQAARRQLAELPEGALGAVRISSQSPLAEQDRSALEENLDRAERVEYQTSPELGAGVRIATVKGLIDASVAGLSDFARHALRREIEQTANHFSPQEPAGHE